MCTLSLTLMLVASSPASGCLTGRFGPRVPITAGLLVVTAASLGPLFLETDSSYAALWSSLLGMGMGIGPVVPE